MLGGIAVPHSPRPRRPQRRRRRPPRDHRRLARRRGPWRHRRAFPAPILYGRACRPIFSSTCRAAASREGSNHRSCRLYDHRRGAEGRAPPFRNARAHRRHPGLRRPGQLQGDDHRGARLHRPARRHCPQAVASIRMGFVGEGHASSRRAGDKAREVVEANRAAGRRVAVAESCTGGLVSAALTEIAGSSDVFEAGYVTYSNAAKVVQLQVSEEVVETFGAVSVATAWAMARGALAASDADIAVAITGVAGPAVVRPPSRSEQSFSPRRAQRRSGKNRRRPEIFR